MKKNKSSSKTGLIKQIVYNVKECMSERHLKARIYEHRRHLRLDNYSNFAHNTREKTAYQFDLIYVTPILYYENTFLIG